MLGLLSSIHSVKPSLPIIVMVACAAGLQEVLKAGHLGVKEIVFKPFRKRDIDLACAELPCAGGQAAGR